MRISDWSSDVCSSDLYIKSLDVDIRLEPPPVTPEMKETAAWLTSRSDLFIEPVSGENSRVQITIQLDNIPDLQRFNHEIATCDSVRSGAVDRKSTRLNSSH